MALPGGETVIEDRVFVGERVFPGFNSMRHIVRAPDHQVFFGFVSIGQDGTRVDEFLLIPVIPESGFTMAPTLISKLPGIRQRVTALLAS